jgi:hypothetical protein
MIFGSWQWFDAGIIASSDATLIVLMVPSKRNYICRAIVNILGQKSLAKHTFWFYNVGALF